MRIDFKSSKVRALLVGFFTPIGVALFMVSQPLSAPLTEEVQIEKLTWVEVRELIGHGKTVALVPTGGVEQNGPHMILGKHNYIVHYTADQIARALGNALVAPVVAYVPEGNTEPPTGHMNFSGTLSLPEPVFEAVLEHTARSLKAHGFTAIAFIGDSGGNQTSQTRVAERLTRDWQADGVRVLAIDSYYSGNGQIEWLKARGETATAIGSHAGIRDTSELLAVFPEGVRNDRLALHGGRYHLEATGVHGDPRRASADYGREMLRLKIEAALAQLRAALEEPAS